MAFGNVTFPRSTRTPRSRDGGAWAVGEPKMATRCCTLADLQNRSLWRHTGIWSTQSPSPTVASLRSDHACSLPAMYRYRKSWIYGWPYTASWQTCPSSSGSRRLVIVPPTRHVRRSPRQPTKWAITGLLHPRRPRWATLSSCSPNCSHMVSTRSARSRRPRSNCPQIPESQEESAACAWCGKAMESTIGGRARGQPRHVGYASGGSNEVGNLVPHKFAHAVPLPRNNAVVRFYPAGLTSRVHRGR